jgi:CheY-like chemotaxis protein
MSSMSPLRRIHCHAWKCTSVLWYHGAGAWQQKGYHLSMSIRVLIADDHNVVRKGIRDLLSDEDDIDVVGEARNGQEAVDLASALKPDVVVMDIAMPELSGVEATRQIRAIKVKSTTSKIWSGNASCSITPIWNAIGRWRRAAFARAQAICSFPGSMPTTRPALPTRQSMNHPCRS